MILFPFYPIWGWAFAVVTNKNITTFINFLWVPIVLYYLITKSNKLPKYLLFLIIFTAFHLTSAYFNGIIRSDSEILYYILFDANVVACALLFIIENTEFDERFIKIMNRNIFLVVMISLVVSLIQVKFPSFFISPAITEGEENIAFLEDTRILSIYSWLNINSIGITFPILISLMISVFELKDKKFPLIIFSGIIVSFLTKARYVMISTIIAFSQLFMSSKLSIRNKIIYISFFLVSILAIDALAENYGFSIQQVIDQRILEKDDDMASANARITSYYVFLQKFPENPWFGVGPETRADVVELLGGQAPLIHIGYLSYLYFYGIAGFLILLISIFYLLKRAFMIGKKYLFWGSFYGLVAFCIANTTFVYFNFSEMGIILAVIYLKYFEDKSETDSSEIDAEPGLLQVNSN